MTITILIYQNQWFDESLYPLTIGSITLLALPNRSNALLKNFGSLHNLWVEYLPRMFSLESLNLPPTYSMKLILISRLHSWRGAKLRTICLIGSLHGSMSIWLKFIYIYIFERTSFSAWKMLKPLTWIHNKFYDNHLWNLLSSSINNIVNNVELLVVIQVQEVTYSNITCMSSF